jgi:tetratricopeptide (TPR) repeat protein
VWRITRYCFFAWLLTSGSTVLAQFKLYEKGHDSYKAGKYDEAIQLFTEYFTKPLRDKSLDAEVYYLRALSYYKKKDFRNAITDFEETILLNHQNIGNIYWFKAKSHAELGENQESISAYTSAIRELDLNKESRAKLLYERSLVYSKIGKSDLAYADLKAGAVAFPPNADIKKELERLEKKGVSGSVPDNSRTTQQTANKPEADKKKKDVPAVAVATPVQQSKQEVIQPVTSSLADFYKDEKRYALVIGNSTYPKNIGALKNPVNDATDMAKELTNSNFDVDLLTNATYGQIRAALLKFKEKIDAGDPEKTVALFYFAGHGLQHDDENYLVPIDAAVEFEDDIARYCFPTQRMVLSNMERSNSRMNIVILDACRNNPFPALNRSVEQGLGEMRRARGSFIAYATAPGSVASDGSGRNGLYTQELLKALRKPGLTIEQVFKDVRVNVLRLSGDKQNTWDSSNIVGEFYFKFK